MPESQAQAQDCLFAQRSTSAMRAEHSMLPTPTPTSKSMPKHSHHQQHLDEYLRQIPHCDIYAEVHIVSPKAQLDNITSRSSQLIFRDDDLSSVVYDRGNDLRYCCAPATGFNTGGIIEMVLMVLVVRAWITWINSPRKKRKRVRSAGTKSINSDLVIDVRSAPRSRHGRRTTAMK